MNCRTRKVMRAVNLVERNVWVQLQLSSPWQYGPRAWNLWLKHRGQDPSLSLLRHRTWDKIDRNKGCLICTDKIIYYHIMCLSSLTYVPNALSLFARYIRNFLQQTSCWQLYPGCRVVNWGRCSVALACLLWAITLSRSAI